MMINGEKPEVEQIKKIRIVSHLRMCESRYGAVTCAINHLYFEERIIKYFTSILM